MKPFKLHSRGENHNSCFALPSVPLGFLSALHLRRWRDVQEKPRGGGAAAAAAGVSETDGRTDRRTEPTEATRASRARCPSCCGFAAVSSLARRRRKADVFTTSSRWRNLRPGQEAPHPSPPPPPTTGGLWVEGGRQTSTQRPTCVCV